MSQKVLKCGHTIVIISVVCGLVSLIGFLFSPHPFWFAAFSILGAILGQIAKKNKTDNLAEYGYRLSLFVLLMECALYILIAAYLWGMFTPIA
jgi:hypothetical protein